MNLAASLRVEGASVRSAGEAGPAVKPEDSQQGTTGKRPVAKDALSARLASVAQQRQRFRSFVPEGMTLNDFTEF